MRYLDWRAGLRRIVKLWRSSLQLRTVAISVILSSITVVIIGGYMSFIVGTNLFDSRREQVLDSSSKATIAAQGRFDAVDDADSVDLDSVMALALGAANQAASTPATIAILRTAGQDGRNAPVDRISGDYATLVSGDLRETVAASERRSSYTQSVTLTNDEGATSPGIIVGSQLSIQEALTGYTRLAAWLTFEEKLKGSLEPGKLADFIVLGQDPLTLDPDKLMDVPVLQTWLGGKQLWKH